MLQFLYHDYRVFWICLVFWRFVLLHCRRAQDRLQILRLTSLLRNNLQTWGECVFCELKMTLCMFIAIRKIIRHEKGIEVRSYVLLRQMKVLCVGRMWESTIRFSFYHGLCNWSVIHVVDLSNLWKNCFETASADDIDMSTVVSLRN